MHALIGADARPGLPQARLFADMSGTVDQICAKDRLIPREVMLYTEFYVSYGATVYTRLTSPEW